MGCWSSLKTSRKDNTMTIKIYEPITSLGQTAYTVRFINGNRIDDCTVPSYRINKYIENIVYVSKLANNKVTFKFNSVPE